MENAHKRRGPNTERAHYPRTWPLRVYSKEIREHANEVVKIYLEGIENTVITSMFGTKVHMARVTENDRRSIALLIAFGARRTAAGAVLSSRFHSKNPKLKCTLSEALGEYAGDEIAPHDTVHVLSTRADAATWDRPTWGKGTTYPRAIPAFPYERGTIDEKYRAITEEENVSAIQGNKNSFDLSNTAKKFIGV